MHEHNDGAIGTHVVASVAITDDGYTAAADQGFAGLVVKQQQPSYDAGKATLRDIAIGERYYLIHTGEVTVAVPAGLAPTKGLKLWVRELDNAIVAASDLPDGTDEIQTISLSVSSGSLGGTFIINYDGPTTAADSTAAIAFDASAAAVQAELEGLDGIEPGDVTVTKSGTADAPVWTVAFRGNLAGVNVPAFTLTTTGLTGTGAAGAVATTTAGAAGTHVKLGQVSYVPGDQGLPSGKMKVNLDAKAFF